MAQPVRVRGLTEQEGQKLQHIVRRGGTSSVRFRRAMMLLASAGGSRVPVIARLVQADKDTVRDVIHKFNEIGLAGLDPRWAVGRPRLLDRDDEDFVVQTAITRPTVLGKPFTRWSIRKLADHLSGNITRPVRIGRETLRCLLARRGISFQRTKAWKESPDPGFDAKLARIEYAINQRPDRTFAFDEFGPLGIRPTAGSCWAMENRPDRLPATYRRTHGITYFHGCYSVGDDQLWGINRKRKGIDHTWAALRTIRAACPDGAPIYVILDNLSAGPLATRSSCVSPRPTPPGQTRSRRTSGRCGSSPSPTRTTPITSSRRGTCTPTCVGATRTPATPTSWPPNDENALASAARRAFAGADAR